MASLLERLQSLLKVAPDLRVALRRSRLGFAIALFLAVASLVLPLFLPDPDASDFGIARPADGAPPRASFAHWLGTDSLHRDVCARIAAGGRVSLAVGVSASMLALGLGVMLGVGSATLRKTGAKALDRVLVGIIDVLLALPFLLFVTGISAVSKTTTLPSVIVVLGFSSAVGVARIVRARALEVLERDFVVAARALGATRLRIAFAHVLPNVMGTALVLGTNLVGAMILAEAVLSYLGLGVAPPLSSWGRMMHEAETWTGTRPLLVVAPGLAIVLAAGAFFRIGEGLRATFDPKIGARVLRVPIDLVAAAIAAMVVLAVPPMELRAPVGTVPTGPRDGGTLRIATFVNVGTLDSALANDEVALAIGRHVFGRLLRWDLDGNLAPDLAEHYDVRPGGQEIELDLRRDVVFQDGAPFGASDVKRSIERALNPKSACPQATLYDTLVGFDEYRAGKAPSIEGIRIEGSHRLVFALKRPSAIFLPLLTMGYVAPVCPSSTPIADRRAPALPCGAGPFRIAAIEPEERIVLQKFEAYYQHGMPHIDSIEIGINVRPSVQRVKFERGELDLVRDLSSGDLTLYASDPRFAALRAWVDVAKTDAVFLNTEMPPFDRPAVRRAVAYALDSSVLGTVRPDVHPVDRVVPAALPGPDRSEVFRAHDLDRALASMREAGFTFDPKTGEGGYPDAIDYVTVAGTFEQQVGEIFREQLARIGLRIHLDLESYQAYLAKVQKRHSAAMGWSSWGADFPDPANFFDPVLSSQAIGDMSENSSFYANPALDALLHQAEVTQSSAERMALFARAERIVADDAPWIPVYSSRSLEVWQPRLAGYTPNPLAPLDFTRAWLGDSP